MKVTQATGSNSRTTSKIDLELGDVPRDVKNDIIQETGELLVEQILLATAEARSPVVGERFKALSKDYKARKVAQGGQPTPDLELDGAMKDALTFKPTATGLEIGFFGKQAGKADGHNNFSGNSAIPQRRFLPGEGQSFKPEIEGMVQGIIDEKLGEAFEKADFEDVETKAQLYEVLGQYYSGTRSEIRQSAASSSGLLDILIKLDLMELL